MSNPPFAFGQYQPAAQFDMNRITANVGKMREQGAPDEDVEHYLQNVEGLRAPQPETPTGPRSTYDVNDAVVHGLTRGWSEKAAAGIWTGIDKLKGAPGSYGDVYQQDLAQRNAARQAYETGSPGTNRVGETIGTALPYLAGGAAGLLRAPLTLLGRAAMGGALGGTESALNAGASAAPGEELPAMAHGGLVGGLTGAVAYPALGALGDRLATSGLGGKVLSAANTGLGMLTGRDAAIEPMIQSSPQGRALAVLRDHPAFADDGLELRAASAPEPSTLARLGNRKLTSPLLAQTAKGSPEALNQFVSTASAARDASDPLYEASRTTYAEPISQDVRDLGRIGRSIDRMPSPALLAPPRPMPVPLTPESRAALLGKLVAARTGSPTPGFGHMNQTAEALNEPPGATSQLLRNFNSQFAAPERVPPALGGAPSWLGNPIAAQDADAMAREQARERIRALYAPEPVPPPAPPPPPRPTPTFRATPLGKAPVIPTGPIPRTVTLTPDLRSALDNPIMAHAYETGRNIAATEGVTLPPFPAGAPEDAMTQTAKTVGRAFGGAGSAADIARTMSPSQLALPGNEIFRDALKGTDELPVQGLDYMKRGLDKLIQQGQAGQYTIDNTAARALRSRLNGVLDLVDQQIPGYGKARATAAVYKQLEPAILAGQKQQGAQLLSPPSGNTPSAWEMASAAEGHPYGQVSLASRLLRGQPPSAQLSGPLANLLTVGAKSGDGARLQALVRALGNKGQAPSYLPALMAMHGGD